MIEVDILPASTESQGGDSVLIRIGEFSYNGDSNEQKVILIDGGYSDTADTIETYLDEHYGTNTIDYLFLTHPDLDHISGIEKLIRNGNIKIKKTYIHDPWNHTEKVFKKTQDGRVTINSIGRKLEGSLNKLTNVFNELNVTNTEPFAGIEIKSLNIRVLGPKRSSYVDLLYTFPEMEGAESSIPSDVYEKYDVQYDENMEHFLENPATTAKNNTSAIILLSDKEDKPLALFTGDAGVDMIQEALDYADDKFIVYEGVDLFQLPHHGSIKNIDEEILERISPKKCFVSAPKDKRDHPAKHLLNYLHKKEIGVKHITEVGGIRFSYDGAPGRPGWTPVVPFTLINEVPKLKV